MIDLNPNSIAPDFARVKTCSTCRTRRWLLDFPRRTLCKHDGRAAVCKDCHREYSRAYVRANRDPESHAATQRAWRIRNPDRSRAHAAVQRALKSGLLLRPDACADCGRTAALEAHHTDYSRQLDVVWLCVRCHGLRHRDGTRGRQS